MKTLPLSCKQMWHDELGIQMDLRPLEAKIFYTAQAHLDFDLSRSSWIGDYDEREHVSGLFTSDDGNNRTGWKNAQYDELIGRANQEPDLQVREKLFQQAETILVRDELPSSRSILRRHQLLRHEQDPRHLPEHSRQPPVAGNPEGEKLTLLFIFDACFLKMTND